MSFPTGHAIQGGTEKPLLLRDIAFSLKIAVRVTVIAAADDDQVSTALQIRPTSQMWLPLIFGRRTLARRKKTNG